MKVYKSLTISIDLEIQFALPVITRIAVQQLVNLTVTVHRMPSLRVAAQPVW